MKIFIGLTVVALYLGAAGALWAQGTLPAQEAPVDSLALARQYTTWLYTGQVDSLVAHSSDPEKAAQESDYGQVSRLIAERAGFEVRVVEETWKLRNGRCQYWRTAEFTAMPEAALIRWVLDSEGRIDGFGAGPATQAPPVEAETCAPR